MSTDSSTPINHQTGISNGTDEQQEENVELEHIADHFEELDGWDVEHETPSIFSTDPGEEMVVIEQTAYECFDDPTKNMVITEGQGPFSRKGQAHGKFDTNGIRIKIKAHENKRSSEPNLFSTHYSILLNDAEVSGTSLVTYAGATEAIEWAERLMAAVENTPEGWVPVERDTFTLNSWATKNGRMFLKVEQEDRNMGEYRKYKIALIRNDPPGDTGRQIVADDLRTEDLYSSVIDAMQEVSSATTHRRPIQTVNND